MALNFGKKWMIYTTAFLVGLISLSWMAWLEFTQETIPNLIYPSEGLAADYVIVGGGTAGCVLAHVLSRNSNASVLLIEAGHTFGVISKVPLLAPFIQGSSMDWSLRSVPQKHSSKGLKDQIQMLPRGKGLGGSAQLNYLLHFPGDKDDFERWKEMGVEGWDYETLSPYFDTISNSYEDIWEIPADYSLITDAFERARKELKRRNFRRSQYNVKKGVRWSVYQKYLRSAFESKNLKILTKARVYKIVVRESRARSVLLRAQTERGDMKGFEIIAKKEIVLALGAFHTPHLLQVSGIGPRQVLEKRDIDVVHNLPAVGENLHDHMNLPLFVSISQRASLNANALLSPKEIWKYLRTGQGHFGNFGVLGHIDAGNDTFGITVFGTGAIDETALMDMSNFKRDHFRSLFPKYHNRTQEGLVILSTCYQPKSRGTVKPAHKDIRRSPLIDPNYLSAGDDVQCTIKAIRLAVDLLSSEAFRPLHPKIHWPKIKECANFGPFGRDFQMNRPSNRYLECVLKDVGLASHHPGGSCAISKCVDSDLKLKGIDGLRVIDASILPTPISGNPAATIVAMAKRGAHLILQDGH